MTERANGDVTEGVWGLPVDDLRRHFHSRAVSGARDALKLMGLEEKAAEVKPYEPEATTWREIVSEICQRRKLPEAIFYGPLRTRHIVAIRQEVAYWVRVRCGASYLRIAKIVGVTDPTTVMHSVRAHAKRHKLPLNLPNG